ncbi:MAG: SdrD B-like domain-containing protein [Caldilineaceae bacterium]
MSLTKRIIFFLSIIALSLVGCCLPSGDLLVIDSEGMFTLRPLRAAPGTLTGQVFLDADYNGQRDVGGAGGDTPWPNVPVTLWTKVGAATSTTTDANGVYSFSADPGRYEIGVTGQGNYLFSPQDVGDDATDSDVGPTGRSATVVLTSTQVITIDAGMGIPPTPTPTPTPPQSPLPTPPPFSPLPTPTPTPEGYTLPTDRSLLDQCFFTPPPGGIPNEPIIPLSAYSFSAPQEVITHTAPIGIEQWLPDNETLLITRESMENQLVSVDLVNTTTGVVTQIVEPLQYLMEPRWLSLNDTVAWRAIGTLDDMDPGLGTRLLGTLT